MITGFNPVVELGVADQLTEKLDQLGFSSNEIKVLLYLYTNKEPQRADAISDATSVALTRVYESLDLLAQKEFIGVIPGRPRRYRVLPPPEALSSFVEQEKKRLEEKLETTQRMVNDTLDLAQGLYLKHHTQIEADELLLQFKSLEDTEARTIKIIEEAEFEILIFTHVFQWFERIKEPLLAALDRGCEVKILMQPEVEPGSTIKEIDPVDIQYLTDLGIKVRSIASNEMMTRGTIVDRKYVVFVIWVDQPALERQPRIYRPQYSSNPGIVDVFYGYFQHLFQSSTAELSAR